MTRTMTRSMEDVEAGRRSVLGRVFDILDCFSGSEPDQSITSLCDQTGLPAATVHRMLATLVEWGAVERSGRGQYRLGMRLWRLGWGVPEAREVRDVARPHMVDLYAATREIVVLCSRDGDDLLLVDQIAGSAAGPSLRSSRRRPLGSCAAGLIYLAHLELGELRARLAESTLGLPERLRRDEFRLLQVLGEVRRTGVASTPDDGRRWFSAPVFNAEGELRSTISMLVPDGRAVVAAHAPLVARTAREISAGLGARRLLHHA
jgi:DNA-binding IclR family transcriptional regulator